MEPRHAAYKRTHTFTLAIAIIYSQVRHGAYKRTHTFILAIAIITRSALQRQYLEADMTDTDTDT